MQASGSIGRSSVTTHLFSQCPHVRRRGGQHVQVSIGKRVDTTCVRQRGLVGGDLRVVIRHHAVYLLLVLSNGLVKIGVRIAVIVGQFQTTNGSPHQRADNSGFTCIGCRTRPVDFVPREIAVA